MGFEFGGLKFMKLLFLLLLLPSYTFALPASTVPPRNAQITATGGSPIPVSYGLGATSRVISGLSGFRHMSFINNTACGIMVNTSADSIAPADGSDHNIPIAEPALSQGETFDDIYIAGSVYIRANCSPPATITAGSVIIKVW